MNVVSLAPGPRCRSAPPASWHPSRVALRAVDYHTATPPAASGRHPTRAAIVVITTMLWFQATMVPAGQWPWALPIGPPQKPHPSVVRVAVEESDGTAHGSGTLVDVRDQFGIVVTNWHVVRDATGAINVVFPDGFRSAARVLRVDRDWDLAALVIWRPNAEPIRIAAQAPRPGEPLTIAGYGPGDYRAATGRCTQYVAPSDHHPFEMVEVATTARQGDSGGPILNSAGELAGVLFGSGGGTTSGSYAGRVYQFLSTAWPPNPASELPGAIAATPRGVASLAPLQPLPEKGGAASTEPTALADLPPVAASRGKFASHSVTPKSPAKGVPQEQLANAGVPQTHATTLTWHDVAGDSIPQQCKTFLAIVGLFTLLTQFTRLFAPRERRG